MNPRKIKPIPALRKALWALIYALPAVLFFSYYPIISLGSNSSMNFELSLPLLWLVLFDATAFLSLILNWKSIQSLKRDKSVCYFSESSQEPDKKNGSSKLAIRFPKSSREREARATEQNTRKDGLFCGIEGREIGSSDGSFLSDRRFFLFSIFPFYATLSIFWSANPLRAILTAGIIWLLFFAIFAIIYILPLMNPPKSFRRHLLATFFISTALVCVFCFIQSILDACGLSRTTTLLCAGCTSYSFGFPHPSGFAIEPQFMGNLLLAPTLTALYLLTFDPKWQRTGDNGASGDTSSVKRLSATNEERTKCRLARNDGPSQTGLVRKKYWSLVALCVLFSTTLFFTFSRGAIYAYAVALAILLIFSLTKRHFRWTLITIPVCTFLLSLGLQGAFSALGPTSETFTGGVTKSIHQLSLGLIDLRSLDNSQKSLDTPQNSSETSQNPPETSASRNPDNNSTPSPEPSESAPDSPESSIFEGYVAESTNVRLNLNKAALDTWLNTPDRAQISFGADCGQPYSELCRSFTPTSILFGVGLGGAGTALYLNRDITGIGSPKEIVQNQFFSLLLELGLVGIALALFTLLLAFFPSVFPKKFLDGRAAGLQKATAPSNSVTSKTPKLLQNPFFQHPALPLLASLIIAYLITLNFFSGLPNALHIYLLPPLLFFTFARSTVKKA